MLCYRYSEAVINNLLRCVSVVTIPYHQKQELKKHDKKQAKFTFLIFCEIKMVKMFRFGFRKIMASLLYVKIDQTDILTGTAVPKGSSSYLYVMGRRREEGEYTTWSCKPSPWRAHIYTYSMEVQLINRLENLEETTHTESPLPQGIEPAISLL